MRISAQEAEAILKKDLAGFEAAVAAMVRMELTQAQFDVLVSFAYNCGVGALKTSTLLKRVNAGAFDAVPAELMKWTKAKGKELQSADIRHDVQTDSDAALDRRLDRWIGD